MQSKKVSIILPVYNGEGSISRAIDSILSQTYKNWELIIVNDCSTDSTARIIEAYALKDKRIIIVNNKVNKKLPRSLNIGFQTATGEYLTWTSDDNMYRETAIERMLYVLENEPGIGMVYTDFTKVNELENSTENSLNVVVSNIENLRLRNVVGACFLYRSSVAKQIGEYDADLFLAEDYDYWIRIWKNSNCYALHENLYIYRVHAKSLTTTQSERVQVQAGKVISKHYDYLYSTCKNRAERIEFFDNLLKYVGGDRKKRELRRIFKDMPSYRINYILNQSNAMFWDYAHRFRVLVNKIVRRK